MGLGVYLAKFDNYEYSMKLEMDYLCKQDEIWKKIAGEKSFDDATDEQKEDAKKIWGEFATIMGLDNFGRHTKGRQLVELNSKKWPDHMFKIGYFRSGYNTGGFNQMLQKLVSEDLYTIFNIKDESGFTTHDWEKVKNRIEQVKSKISKHKEDTGGYHNVVVVRALNGEVASARDAIALFRKEKLLRNSRSGDFFDSFVDGNKYFYLGQELQVVAAIPGVEKNLGDNEQVPVVYLVVNDDIDWYMQALDIIEETCNFVMSQPDSSKYYLRWKEDS